ncbi:EAL domain-containing protein [Pseudidiomarina sp. GXY010]|uniref:EAL domain-containing protein n=1 Tax=Pseudidiomarina fusca TaxID=2965078 RepID=A0ABU3KY53_9GAMM|nr:EAL domain-containing protein [Pseudidiomarina sp. GXY010]MDT7526391.1 EAL domain-containing protein [Pseudidiomarina sp. GXY010]
MIAIENNLLLFIFILLIVTMATGAGALWFWLRARYQQRLLKQWVQANYDTLSSIATDQPLEQKLSRICALLESQIPFSFASVMVANEQRTSLSAVATARLPKSLFDGLQMLPIANGVGACGTAAAQGRPVVVAKMHEDTRFEAFMPLIKQFKLSSAWSFPVYTAQQQLLGTLAVYSERERLPNQQQRAIIERSCELLALVMQQHHERLARERSEQRANSLFAYNPEAVFTLDLEGRFTSLNAAGEALVQASEREILGQRYDVVVLEEDKQRTQEHFLAAVAGQPQRYEIRILNSAGQLRTLNITNMPMKVNHQVVGVHGIAKDVTQQRDDEERLVLFRRCLESSTDGIVISDARKPGYPLIYVNPAFTQITGYSEAEMLGDNCDKLRGPDTDLAAIAEIDAAIAQQIEARTVIKNYRKDGSMFWNELLLSPVRDDQGELTHWVGVQTDITERVERERSLAFHASHDPLTGLPNRSMLEQRLQQALADDSAALESVFVLFIDLDGFKPINDSLGHEFGDEILVQTGQRLRAVLPAEDLLARFGGDEFVAVVQSQTSIAAVTQLAQRLLDQFLHPFVFEQAEVSLSAAIGIATNDSSVRYPNQLIQHADVAMYEVKRRGSNGLQWFSPVFDEGAQLQIQRRSQLQEAIAQQQFELFYQPIVSAQGAIHGVEALIRWKHPEQGFISPAEFIPLAEKTGQIIAISEWVLNQACMDSQTLREAGVPHVAVNFSPMQFYRDDFVESVERIIKPYNLRPGQLVAEITENVLMRDSSHIFEILQQLRELGLEIALDDFGTGYASLSYLTRIPAQRLKIDRSFIDNIHQNTANAAITRGILTMAAELGIATVAEGVETEAELAYLQRYACDYMQGFLFCKPLPLPELLAWLNHK